MACFVVSSIIFDHFKTSWIASSNPPPKVPLWLLLLLLLLLLQAFQPCLLLGHSRIPATANTQTCAVLILDCGIPRTYIPHQATSKAFDALLDLSIAAFPYFSKKTSVSGVRVHVFMRETCVSFFL